MFKMSINIFGVVGEDVRASDVIKQIQAEKGKVIDINIMSVGGNVREGLAIYDALREVSANGQEVRTFAIGITASIASIIFMAGDRIREVSDNAEVMVHNSSVMTGGNKHDLEGAIETLDGIDARMIEIYASRTGLSNEELVNLLDKETFMSADEAVSKGFATEKTNALALVAILNKQKEPVNMANEKEEEEKGMFNKFKAWLNIENKAEEIPEKEDDAAEEARDEDEKPDFEAENLALKAEIAELKAKAESDEEEKKEMEAKAEEEKAKAEDDKEAEEEAKAMAIFQATVVNKITLVEAKNLLSKPSSFVNETLKGKTVNMTGLDKTEVPKKEVVNHYETWQAMLKTSTADAQNYYKKHRDSISKEK